jgi:hypothetical protein
MTNFCPMKTADLVDGDLVLIYEDGHKQPYAFFVEPGAGGGDPGHLVGYGLVVRECVYAFLDGSGERWELPNKRGLQYYSCNVAGRRSSSSNS